MKLLIPLLFPCLAIASDLSGFWRNSQAPGDRPIQFLLVNNKWYFHSQERFVFPNGKLSHTIDQSVKLNKGENLGSVDFFDSRGCSFKNLPVIFDFQDEDTVNVLMTVPRYQFVTTTETRPYERPRYCTGPRGQVYICGSDQVISRSSECRLLDEVQTAVQLRRLR